MVREGAGPGWWRDRLTVCSPAYEKAFATLRCASVLRAADLLTCGSSKDGKTITYEAFKEYGYDREW